MATRSERRRACGGSETLEAASADQTSLACPSRQDDPVGLSLRFQGLKLTIIQQSSPTTTRTLLYTTRFDSSAPSVVISLVARCLLTALSSYSSAPGSPCLLSGSTRIGVCSLLRFHRSSRSRRSGGRWLETPLACVRGEGRGLIAVFPLSTGATKLH
jgi:hypothetical protein